LIEEQKSAQKWFDELKRYKKVSKKFVDRGRKINERYLDERSEQDTSESRFNILWSNVQTLKPAIFSRVPKPEVSRRFKDDSPIARTACEILERVLSYEITQYSDYQSALSNSVEDRLLPGRGVAWVRYEPNIETVEEPLISEDVESESLEENGLAGQESFEQITSELSPVDYVFWEDFSHSPARTWEEVTWVARRVYMAVEEGVERFGDDFRQVPLTHSPDKNQADTSFIKDEQNKAEVIELWHKPDKKVIWLAEGYQHILDERDDPLELQEFFPCPKPLYATTSTKSLVPVADFILYQDQAKEIDEITGRIRHLTKALQVKGFYAADEDALKRILSEGRDGDMIPIENWPSFADKGGIKGAVEYFPLGEIANVLIALYGAREAAKQVVYEVTGISDIIRGASVASETATAQNIKSQFASLRLSSMKNDVARFACDLLRIKAEVICSKYQPQTLVEVSGIMMTNDAQYVEQALQLLQSEPARNFQIDIESDTLVEIDERQDKQDRVEFLSAAGGFLEKAIQGAAQAPSLAPLMAEMLLFGVRGFKAGRGLEGAFEKAIQSMKTEQEQKAQQPPQPSPDQVKMQMQMEIEKGKGIADVAMKKQEHEFAMEIERGKGMVEAAQNQAAAQVQMQLEQMRLENELQIEQMRLEMEKYKADLDAQTQLEVANITAQQNMAVQYSEANNAIL
jgi:hypothetical protein